MAGESTLQWATIDDGFLKDIYDSDQDMYPAPELTYARLKSWADAFPEFCLCLRSGSPDSDVEMVHGVIIVLPLRKPFWDRLRRGYISEHNLDSASMFPPPMDSLADGEEEMEVGLHVFHIERYQHSGFPNVCQGARFADLALEEIRSRVTRTSRSWDVVGYSALTATRDGSVAFKRLGFTPSKRETGTGRSLLLDDAEMVERKGNHVFLDPHPEVVDGAAGE